MAPGDPIALAGCFTGNIEADRALLGGLLNRLGVPVTVLSLLMAHAEAVKRETVRLGLVAPGDVALVIPRHTADSLLFALVKQPLPGERWVDVGTGAGFPGLVLACCFPLCAFTLIEPLRKRAGFLELQMTEMGLANVSVQARRLEQLEHGGFDVATARALAEPEAALKSMVRVVKPGGVVILATSATTAGMQDRSLQGKVRLETVDEIGDVDSPGRFFIMARDR